MQTLNPQALSDDIAAVLSKHGIGEQMTTPDRVLADALVMSLVPFAQIIMHHVANPITD